MGRLDRLLKPRSAVVIGGRAAAVVAYQLGRIGFAGPVWPVSPTRSEISGLPCYPSVADLPAAPDLAFIAVARQATIDVVAQLNAIGTGGAVCYASGFGETGPGGESLEQELVVAAGEMPFFGPNCYGFVNYLDRVAAWPDEHGGRPVDRGAVIVTQSGNMGLNFTMQRRGLPLAGLYTLGNQATITIADMVAELAGDDRVTAIGLHIEGLDDVAAFAEAAETARARRTPIVALKTGRSAAAARITESHTSSLAGPDDLYDALFMRLGIGRVRTPAELLETLKLLHYGGPIAGRRIASMSCSGGEAALVADLAEPMDLEFPELDPVHAERVASTLSEMVAVSNPLDYHTFIWNDELALTTCFTAMMSGGFDATMLVLDYPNDPDLDPEPWLASSRAMASAARVTGARGVVVATLPECFPEPLREEVAKSGLAPMMGLDDCLAAFQAAATIGQAWAGTAEPLTLCLPAGSTRAFAMDEAAAKATLAEYGVPVPRGQVCAVSDVLRAAAEVGYPVVLKAVDAALTHKTEAGAVAVGLADEAAVEAATKRMAGLSERFLVEEMVGDGVAEIIVGIKPDPQFGLALVLGSGGVLTELVGDSVTLLLPTTEAEVSSALRRLKVSTLLAGYRGQPAGDAEAAIAAIMDIARLAQENSGTLGALDVNPLIVRPTGVCAADAWIKV